MGGSEVSQTVSIAGENQQKSLFLVCDGSWEKGDRHCFVTPRQAFASFLCSSSCLLPPVYQLLHSAVYWVHVSSKGPTSVASVILKLTSVFVAHSRSFPNPSNKGSLLYTPHKTHTCFVLRTVGCSHRSMSTPRLRANSSSPFVDHGKCDFVNESRLAVES